MNDEWKKLQNEKKSTMKENLKLMFPFSNVSLQIFFALKEVLHRKKGRKKLFVKKGFYSFNIFSCTLYTYFPKESTEE